MARSGNHVLAVAGMLAAVLWSSPVHAGLITVDWDVVPHDDREIHFGDSRRYNCEGDRYTERYCRSLWQGGLELGAVEYSFYDDKWFDGYGFGESLVFRIQPVCKSGLRPCFDQFTPVTLRIDGESDEGPAPNLLITSSRGGVMKIPSLRGVTSIDFAGSEWENLVSMELGFYLPEACEDAVPPDDVNCDAGTEKALIPQDLTFQPVPDVPEPAVAMVMSTGLLGLIGWRGAVLLRKHSLAPSTRRRRRGER